MQATALLKSEPLVVEVPENEFSLDHTLDSAQCFSWNRLDVSGFSAWKGVINSEPVVAIQRNGFLEFYTDLPLADLQHFFSLEPGFSFNEVLKSLVIESEHDEVLLAAMHSFPGMRILRQELWETLASFICSQNSNVAMIRERVSLLAKKFGEKIGEDVHSFPPASRIAHAASRDLLACKMGYRASFLKQTASIVEKEIDLEQLRRMNYAEARGVLLELPGVGPKVADCVCLFSLGHLNAFPIDTHVFQVLRDFYAEELISFQGKRKHLRYEDLSLFAAKKFGLYCGYAQQYLFQLHRVGAEKLENFYA